jgi:hypothetical protein
MDVDELPGVGHSRTYSGQDLGGGSGAANRLLSPVVRVLLVEGVLDLLAHGVLLAVEAVGVGGVQDGDAVPGAGGDLGGCAGGGQPQRQGGVPQVVRPPGQRSGGQDGAERVAAGGVPLRR